MNEFDDYKKSFLFGVKFISLVLALFIPIIVFSLIGMGIYSMCSKAPYLSRKALKIEQVFAYKDESMISKDHLEQLKSNKLLLIFEINNKDHVYAYVNRQVNGSENRELEDQIRRIIVKDEIKDTFKVGDNGLKIDVFDKVSGFKTATELYLWTPKDSWDSQVVYEGLTSFGGWLVAFICLGLFILGVASYFPIIKALVNLIKKKRVF